MVHPVSQSLVFQGIGYEIEIIAFAEFLDMWIMSHLLNPGLPGLSLENNFPEGIWTTRIISSCIGDL